LKWKADALVAVRCGNVTLTEGADGPGRRSRRHSRHKQLRKPNTTFRDVREGR